MPKGYSEYAQRTGKTIADRLAFYSEQPADPDACVIYRGLLNGRGYGRVSWKGKMLLAHREAWKIKNGDIPAGMKICHTCDVKPCINDRHLFPGTSKQNSEDMTRKGRQAKGERINAAKITADQAKAIRRDPRLYREISADYGIGISTISWIKTGKGWRHAC